MTRNFLIAGAAIMLTACGGGTNATDAAFKESCEKLALKEDLGNPAAVCECGSKKMAESLSAEDYAIAAKMMSYDSPSKAREAMGDVPNAREIVSQLSDVLESCENAT